VAGEDAKHATPIRSPEEILVTLDGKSGRAPTPSRSTQPLTAAIVPRPHDGITQFVMRDAALDYAARGLPVFPCQARGKKPLTRNGFKDASSHREHVWHWWRRCPHANIGLATGPGSGWLVVDLDGPAGRASWERLIRQHGRVQTLAAITGGGGLHLVFAYPDRLQFGNTAGRLGPGIDTRGAGGYIIAAPSLHPSGRRYQWLEPRLDPAPLPEWLLELLLPPPLLAPSVQPPRINGGGYWRRALQGECDRLARATVGQRNHALNRAAFRLGQLEPAGASFDDVTAALGQVAQELGLGQRETALTIRSGWSAGARRPRGAA
jgi:Bifunctional DNA primase/polymerase, N-terminal